MKGEGGGSIGTKNHKTKEIWRRKILRAKMALFWRRWWGWVQRSFAIVALAHIPMRYRSCRVAGRFHFTYISQLSSASDWSRPACRYSRTKMSEKSEQVAIGGQTGMSKILRGIIHTRWEKRLKWEQFRTKLS